MKTLHGFGFALALMGAFACGSKNQPIYGQGDDNARDDSDDSEDAGSPKGSKDAGKDAGHKTLLDANLGAGGGGGHKDATTFDNACFSTPITVQPNSPQFLIVLDRSASMIGLGPNGGLRWQPSVAAVKQFTSQLTETIDFGLMLFPGPSMDIFDPMAGCTAGTINVPIGLNTADAIGNAMDQLPPDLGQTPTAATMQAALDLLDMTRADSAMVPTYVLLITDGQPNCGKNGSDTGADDITAVDDVLDKLLMANIKTFVIGYDMANNPPLAANMEEFAQHGGTEHALAVEDEQSLIDKLTGIAGATVSCEVDLSGDDVDMIDPMFLRVEIDGQTYSYGTDWTLDGKKVILTDGASACSKLRDAKVHKLDVTRECEPVLTL